VDHLKIPANLSKEQLINDLVKLRQRVDELEKIKEEKKKYLEELHKAKAMFEGLFEFAPDAIVVVGRGGRIVQANKQAERLFGYTRKELLNADHDMLVPQRFREKHLGDRNTYMAKPRTRGMGTGRELYGRRKDGSEFPVDIALGPMKQNKESVVLAVVRDVTERKKWEDAIRELSKDAQLRARELERAYEDMKSFSYSVSHDLREPVMIIDGFSRALLKKYGSDLDDNGKEMLFLISETSEKMSRLITDLLSFARISARDVVKFDVDLRDLAQDVFKQMKPAIVGRQVKFDAKALPAAWGDPSLMRQVLVNLLSNALKFTRPREKAQIEIGGSVGEGETVYYIKDNGIGFSGEQGKKLFDYFKRLNPMDQFEGTGLGLAIVKRIIEKHGGRVWAEGKPEEGAKFYFALPVKAG
jgi:PAS domain S-box-containing protein